MLLGLRRGQTGKADLRCGFRSSRASVARVGAGGAGRCSRCVSAGEYTCCFEAQGFRWELSQVVKVPLQATDVARLPDQLSISWATCPGFQLTCCVPSTHVAYTASWSPREGSKGTEGLSGPGDRRQLISRQLALQLAGSRGCSSTWEFWVQVQPCFYPTSNPNCIDTAKTT